MDELKKFLNIEREHIYWSNNHFRIKVFNPAIKEITKQLEWDIKVKNIKAGRTIKELEISFKDVNKGGLFSKDNMAKGNKQTRLNQANRDADLRAKIAQLSHHKKIGIK